MACTAMNGGDAHLDGAARRLRGEDLGERADRGGQRRTQQRDGVAVGERAGQVVAVHDEIDDARAGEVERGDRAARPGDERGVADVRRADGVAQAGEQLAAACGRRLPLNLPR